MTTITKTVVAVLAATSGAAASTKGSPGAASSWIDLGAYDGGDLLLSVLNGGTGPTTGGTILIQASTDNGTTIADYWGYAGDTSAFSSSTGAGLVTNTIWIDPGVRYLRVIGYGNAGSAVTFAATFSGVTRA